MRTAIALTALLASLAAAPAADAAVNFRVNDTGDAPDQTPTAADGRCETAANTCTLRAALMQANATPGADSIDFADNLAAVRPAAQLPGIVGPVRIEGGGDITIAPSAPVALPLILITEGATSGAGSTARTSRRRRRSTSTSSATAS